MKLCQLNSFGETHLRVMSLSFVVDEHLVLKVSELNLFALPLRLLVQTPMTLWLSCNLI